MRVLLLIFLIAPLAVLEDLNDETGPGPGWTGVFMYAGKPSEYAYDRFACMLNINEVPGDCFVKELTCEPGKPNPTAAGMPRMLDTDDGFHCCTCKPTYYRRKRDGHCLPDTKCDDTLQDSSACGINEVAIDETTAKQCDDVTCENASKCGTSGDKGTKKKCRCKEGYARDGEGGPCIERMLCFVKAPDTKENNHYSRRANV
ncbi:hypothetical protein AAVH_07835 [Aphelenchoides avenae]|nr:hypothetical protein AAVH_07835 [Aphelenchus avenae]